MKIRHAASTLCIAALLSGCGRDEAGSESTPVGSPAPAPSSPAPPPQSTSSTEGFQNPFLAASTWPIYHANTYATATVTTVGPGVADRFQSLASLTASPNGSPYVSPWTVFGEVYADGSQPVLTTPNDGVAKYLLKGDAFEAISFLALDRNASDTDWGILMLRGGSGVVAERKTNRLVLFGDAVAGDPRSRLEVKRRIDINRNVYGSLLPHFSLAPDGVLIALTDADRLIAVNLQTGVVLASFDLPTDSGASFQNSFPVDETGRLFVAAQNKTVAVDWRDGRFRLAWSATYDMRGPGCEDVPLDRSRLEEIRAVTNGETCTGTGTTPTLLGDPASGVMVIVDGHSPRNNLLAFWRGEPPTDWRPLPDPNRPDASSTDAWPAFSPCRTRRRTGSASRRRIRRRRWATRSSWLNGRASARGPMR